MTRYVSVLLLTLCLAVPAKTGLYNRNDGYRFGRLKYGGGGDWYGDRTALGNLARYCNRTLGTNFDPVEGVVEPSSAALFAYPMVFMTGHGNIAFTLEDVRNLRNYLAGGGFLHACDNYGMDKYFRAEMKKVFPELSFVELPYTHPIFHQKFNFKFGLPKIHEHEGKRPQAFALIYKGRMVCFYDYECDLGNGWEDVGTYSDPPGKHEEALEMGANLVKFAFSQ